MTQPVTSLSAMQALLSIMAKLRDPETGCPWDVEQSFSTIAPYTLEEAYEVVDAIAKNDMPALCEELGDLLLQVVFHAQMAEENGLFNFSDVAEGIAEKLIRRHPHVFSEQKTLSAADVAQNWEEIKAQEKRQDAHPGVLANVPIALPALTRALKLQKKAAKVGFDWQTLEPIFAKLEEEVAELKVEIEKNEAKKKIAGELGDILFVCANLARRLELDPEDALRATNRKFEQRFSYIEKALSAQGKTPQAATLEEMDALWEEAKKHNV